MFMFFYLQLNVLTYMIYFSYFNSLIVGVLGNNGDAAIWSNLWHYLRVFLRSTVDYHRRHWTSADI